MSTVSVRQAHQLGAVKAKGALESFAADMQKRGARLEWTGSKAAVKGPGVSGTVDVTEDVVTVDLKLGLLARAAGIDAQKLQGSIARRLESALTDS